MVSIKNLSNTVIHFFKTFSWPLSGSRTQVLSTLLFSIALFCLFFSASDPSPASTAAILSARLLPAVNYVSSLSSIISPNPPSVSEVHVCSSATDSNTLAAATIGKGSHLGSKDHTSCNIYDGNWVVDDSGPLYKPGSCPFIDDSFDCFGNGRPDSDYLRLRWKPHHCEIPRFEGLKMLEMLRGKRMVFVGDSLNRNMWQSLVCALRETMVNKSRISEISGRTKFRTQGFYSFKLKDYNCTVDFIKSPFLVQEWRFSDKAGRRRETLRLDLIQSSSYMYQHADIIIFNTGHWWTHQKTFKGNYYFQEGKNVYKQLEVADAYEKALRTWARWVDANINANRTIVFFRGYSASHFKGGQWNSGGSCDGETQPITDETYLGKYSWMMSILESVIAGMKTPVHYLNITKLTEYRKDGHPSIFRQPALAEYGSYTNTKGENSPRMFQDCSHWCLPGVPDFWNELLFATLLNLQSKNT